MANAFTKAAKKVETPKATKTAKETNWLVGADQNEEELALAITEVNECQRQAKALEARANMFKSPLKAFADDKWTSHMALTGVAPQTPMKITNRAGQSVTFVVQDRSHGHTIKPEVEEVLQSILGPGAYESITCEETFFGFDPIVMLSPAADGSGAVQDVLGERLSQLIETLVDEGKFSREQAENLLTAKTTKTFKPGFLALLPALCGQSAGRFSQAVAAVGSAIVRYIKAN